MGVWMFEKTALIPNSNMVNRYEVVLVLVRKTEEGLCMYYTSILELRAPQRD